MKITSFDPIIVTADAEAALKLFEALGFEKHHAPTNEFYGATVTSVRMKNPGGYHVDIVSKSTKTDADEMLIRVNVDNFEEAYGILTAHGFKNVRGDDTYDAKSSKSATMEGPSGARIAIVKHIKDHD